MVHFFFLHGTSTQTLEGQKAVFWAELCLTKIYVEVLTPTTSEHNYNGYGVFQR